MKRSRPVSLALVGLFVSLPLGRLIARHGPLGPVQAALGLFAAAALLPLVHPQSGLLVLLSRGLEGTAFAVLAIAAWVIGAAVAGPKRNGSGSRRGAPHSGHASP